VYTVDCRIKVERFAILQHGSLWLPGLFTGIQLSHTGHMGAVGDVGQLGNRCDQCRQMSYPIIGGYMKFMVWKATLKRFEE